MDCRRVDRSRSADGFGAGMPHAQCGAGSSCSKWRLIGAFEHNRRLSLPDHPAPDPVLVHPAGRQSRMIQLADKEARA